MNNKKTKLEAGATVNNNAGILIDFKKVAPGQYVVLVVGWNNVTPWVIWTYFEADDSFHWGHYESNFFKAVDTYKDVCQKAFIRTHLQGAEDR